MADTNGTIIIKRVKKVAAGHHGGAWKIAYADFVTAMMAFFLLLWLLNAVTQEQLEGISNYFAPASVAPTASGSGQPLAGTSLTSSEGSLQEQRASSVTVDLPPPKAGEGPQEPEEKKIEEKEVDEKKVDEKKAEEIVKKKEEQQFEEAKAAIREQLEKLPHLAELADSLMIDSTPEGLRIQIIDQEGLDMFPSGSARMHKYTRDALELVSKVIKTLPQKISITGHTDSSQFGAGSSYTNWELSADRANSTRRALIDMGVPPGRLAKVIGAAANEPLVAEDPGHARNRRIAIVLLRGSGNQEQTETPAGGRQGHGAGGQEHEPDQDSETPSEKEN